MKTFAQSVQESKNTHMTHVEDAVIYGGVTGAREAINALRSLRDMVSGAHKGSVSVKWDGAPALFAGIDPSDGVFFVAKKGIFNKNPMVYKTPQDVDNDIKSGDLNVKMKQALKYLPELGIKGVVQGDFLYSQSDLSTDDIEGNKYVTFHPNTIVYAVPAETKQSKEILKSKMGIVWHTTYTGSTFESMSAKFGVDTTKFKKTANVWSQDAMLRDMTGFSMSVKDTAEVNQHLTDAGKIFNKISSTTLKTLEDNRPIAQMIETFNNSFVRKGVIIKDTDKHVTNLMLHINMKFQKEIDKRKTAKGKGAQVMKRDDILAFFSPANKSSLKLMFDLQRHLVLAKLKLIQVLGKLNSTKTFIKTRSGYKTTDHEGYVAIDTLGSGALKIVDRMEFSHNNFSDHVLKGWQKV